MGVNYNTERQWRLKIVSIFIVSRRELRRQRHLGHSTGLTLARRRPATVLLSKIGL